MFSKFERVAVAPVPVVPLDGVPLSYYRRRELLRGDCADRISRAHTK